MSLCGALALVAVLVYLAARRRVWGSKDAIGRKYWGRDTTGSVSRTKEEEGLVGGERTDTSDEEDSSFDVID